MARIEAAHSMEFSYIAENEIHVHKRDFSMELDFVLLLFWLKYVVS